MPDVSRPVTEPVPAATRTGPPAILSTIGAASALLTVLFGAVAIDPGTFAGPAVLSASEEEPMLPLVAVAVALMVGVRTIIGLPTLGTFTPVLLSVSFVASGILVGLLAVGILVAGGLVLEPWLRRAKLPRVSRLGVMVAFAASSLVLLPFFGFDVSGEAYHLPLIATVMVVERLWEDLSTAGPRVATVSGLSTLAVACFAVPVLDGPLLRAFAGTSPLLVTIAAAAAAWAAGSYRGLRLLELRRFGGIRSTGASI